MTGDNVKANGTTRWSKRQTNAMSRADGEGGKARATARERELWRVQMRLRMRVLTHVAATIDIKGSAVELAQIALDDDPSPINARQDGFRCGSIMAVMDDDMRSLGGKGVCGCGTNASGRSSDQNSLALQRSIACHDGHIPFDCGQAETRASASTSMVSPLRFSR